MGVNSKAEAARERRSAVEADRRERVERAKEEQYWREAEGPKSRAVRRREEDAEKRAEAAARKAENRRIACSPPTTTHTTTTVTTTTTAASPAPVATSPADVAWLKAQLASNSLLLLASHDAWHRLRKGINPRTREQQLVDINRHHGISHYLDEGAANHTTLPCPGELLVEEHHSNYGEPWAGGRDVFEFLTNASALTPRDQVLEIGCGTLRVGLHFIRFLETGRFHCLERDELSLMAALRYELPSQGLLYKRPMIVRGEDMDFSKFGDTVMYDLIYASAVFLHIADKLVWTGLERLAGKLRPHRGRIFVSHNIKFCSRLPHRASRSLDLDGTWI